VGGGVGGGGGAYCELKASSWLLAYARLQQGDAVCERDLVCVCVHVHACICICVHAYSHACVHMCGCNKAMRFVRGN